MSSPLDRLSSLVADDMSDVNNLIVQRMDSSVALIPQLAGYIVAAGGKRLRPVLTLAAARMVGYQGEHHKLLAAVVEFIHTATLLHDDVVDESDLRRGQASANAVFGNKSSVLVGDFLFSRSFVLMVEVGSLAVLDILSRASAVIAEGEVLQLSTANNLETSEGDYFKVIAAKTAELFAAACEVGAHVAGRNADECRALRDYGMNLGLAFQISDDVLDYNASEKRLGKTVGDDFREGKMTLPVIKALAAGTDEEGEFWRRTLAESAQNEGDFKTALALLQKHRALEQSMEAAREYCARGRQALASLPAHPLRRHLDDLIIFAAERDY